MEEEFSTINGKSVNHRRYIRTRISLDACVVKVKSIDEETGERQYLSCFHTSVADIGEGGICVSHRDNLIPGDIVELRTKNSLTMKRCLTCEHYFGFEPILQLGVLTGEIVWRTKRRAGIKFINITKEDKKKISTYVWATEIDNAKSNKKE